MGGATVGVERVGEQDSDDDSDDRDEAGGREQDETCLSGAGSLLPDRRRQCYGFLLLLIASLLLGRVSPAGAGSW